MLWLVLRVPLVGLHCVIVAFPDHVQRIVEALEGVRDTGILAKNIKGYRIFL